MFSFAIFPPLHKPTSFSSHFYVPASSNDKDQREIHPEKCARLGEYLKERLWNHNWTSYFLLQLNFELYHEVSLTTEHWKWGCTEKYLLRYVSVFTSNENKIKVKPILSGWVELSNINGFAICKAMTLRNKEI